MLNKSKSYFFSKAFAMIAIVGLLVVCAGCGKKDKDETVSENEGNGEVTMSVEAAVVTPPEGMETTANQDLINLITLYYNALKDGDSATVAAVKKDVSEEEKIRLETRALDIEAYHNMLIYDEPGANAGEYIVLIYSETKFVGIDTKAPGLQATYVRTDEFGNLCIDSNVNEATMSYVEGVVGSEKISTYYSLVQAAYSDAIASDPALNSYMQGIDAKLDAAVAQRQQEAAQAEMETTDTAAVSAVNETVTTTDKVNVRVSDSENADRLGQVEKGTTLTRYEVRENGWSKVDYNGQEGYIKSDYLQSASATPAVDTTATDATETSAPAAAGSVTAKENVRVRNAPNTDSDNNVIGQLTGGQQVEVIENASNGWSKIKYNGQEGYVKTEFLQ